MVPERQGGLAAEHAREHVRHADGERRSAARATDHGDLADRVGQLPHLRCRDRKAQRGDLLGHRVDLAFHVDREILARLQRGRGDQRHDSDEHLRYHAAVSNEADVALPGEQLRGGARCHDGMEARHRGARDRDETEWEDRAGKDRAAAVDEPGERGHAQRRRQHHDGRREQCQRAEFHERAQVVPRREQQPHRQHRGQETVAHDPPGQLGSPEGQRGRQHGAVNPLASGDRQQQPGKAEHAHEPDLPWRQIA